MGKATRNQGLDPQTQFHEIYRNLSTFDFPWDINQALSFALFRTYAVPSIGRLLDETRAFTAETQKRYDDTSLLLEVPLLDGFDSSRGKSAIRRINQMHRMYDISNDDMRYVLSTFVVVPKRWIDDYGWRKLTDDEVTASVNYYRTLGRHMGIKEIPRDLRRFRDPDGRLRTRAFRVRRGWSPRRRCHQGSARVVLSQAARAGDRRLQPIVDG